MKTKYFFPSLVLIGLVLVSLSAVFVPQTKADSGKTIIGDTVIWENNYARLEVTPYTSKNCIVTQVQYANLTWKKPDNLVDVAFRFDIPINKKNIWIWKNISHTVKVNDYGYIDLNYTLENIDNITILDNTPSYVDFGDIPSNFYYEGVANGSVYIIGFDSFQWLNPEHTKAIFYYSTFDVTGFHNELHFWYDWDNINNLFSYEYYNGKHYYYIKNINMVQGTTYSLKWSYDVPVNSNGKWDLLAKLSSDTIQEALSNDRYAMIDPWWSSDWQYFKTINICDKIDDYQMKLIVDYDSDMGGNVSAEGHCNANFSDIRFVYNNVTELPLWIENISSGEQATIWFNNTGNYSSIEMYYGNTDASPVNDGDSVFLFFDDAETGVIDDKWDVDDQSDCTSDYSTDQAFQGSKSIEQNDQTGTYSCRIYVYIPQTTSVKISYKFYHTGDGDVTTWNYLLGDASSLVLYTYATGDIKYYAGGIIDTSEDINLNTWEKFTFFCYDDGTDTEYLNLTADTTSGIDTNVGDVCRQEQNPSYWDTLKIQTNTIGNGGSVYYDDIYITLWVGDGNTEPSFCSFGNEVAKPLADEFIISNVIPVNNSEINCLNLSFLNVTINSTFGSTSGWVNISIVGNSSWYHNVSFTGNNTYSYDVHLLNFTQGVSYIWFVNCSNATTITNVSWFNFSCIVGCGCYDEIAILNYKLNLIMDEVSGDNMEIEFGSVTLSIFLTLVLFIFSFWIGYVSKKRSGGAFMILSGFTLLSFEGIAVSYLSAFYIIPLLTPFAIFIILLGVRKWLYPFEGEYTKSEGT